MKLVFEKIHPDAQIPTYGSEKAAGLDVYSPGNYTIEPGARLLIKTGIKANIPEGTWLSVQSRSGTAVKAGIEKGAGVIDEDYRKEIGILLHNLGNESYHILKGDRIAQMVLLPYLRPEIEEGAVDDNDRGGYGSTGR
jgi:dUTP pyrophosphatase